MNLLVEKERLADLETYDLNGGMPKKELKSIIKLASEICDTSVSLIDIIDKYNQRTVATYGDWKEQIIPREKSICDRVVVQDDLLVINNLEENQELFSRLSEESKKRIKFYAGAPLKSPSGHTLGALCVIDSKPRDLSDFQKESLRTLADEVMARLNLHRQTKLLKQKNKRLEKYSIFLKNSADILCIIDPKTKRIEDINYDINKQLGYLRKEFIGRKFTDFVESQEFGLSDIDSWFSTTKKRNSRQSLPISLKNKMNKERWFQCTLTYDSEKWYLTARNITKQKKAEKRVSILQNKFEKIAKATTDLVFEYNPSTEELIWSDSLTDILGYPPSDKHVDFDWWSSKIHPDDAEDVVMSFSKVLQSEENTWKANYRFKTFDGTYKYLLANVYIDRDELGSPTQIIGALSDISDLRKSELRQKSLLSRLNQANHMAELGYWEVELDTGEVFWSDEMYHILHADKATVKPSVKYIMARCESEGNEILSDFINKLSREDSIGEIEHKISLKESEQKYLSHIGEVVHEDGKPQKIIITTQDITGRKLRELKISKSLKEKETLLAEIHHRVKNNLALISALFELKLFEDIDEETADFIKSSQSRIQSIAKIHEKLYQSDSFSHVSFNEYVAEMIDFLRISHQVGEADVQFNTNIEQVDLNINQAIPCGLIINELITNAIRHAFPGSMNGTVAVSIKSRGSKVTMTVEDDGIGLPDDFSLEGDQSLGMTLIETLSKQINGELMLSKSAKGCKCSVVFEKKDEMKGAGSSFLKNSGNVIKS